MNEKPTVYSRKSPSGLSPVQAKLLEQRHIEVCIEHSHPIEYLCFSCASCLLCAQCLSSSSHQGHDLKSIQRSRQLLRSQLQQWSILLETRCEILGVWGDRLRNNRADIFEYAQLYKQKLAAQFRELVGRLETQLAAISSSITDFSNQYKNDFAEKAKQIRLRQIEIKGMIDENNSKMQTVSIQVQAQYYSHNRQKIQSLLDQSQIVYYRQLLIQPNWGIDADLFKNVNHAISKLNVSFKNLEVQKDFSDLREKVGESLKKSVKKSKKDLRLIDLDKYEKYDRLDSKVRNSNSISPFVTTFTPKNVSKQKKLKYKKSPGQTTLLKKRKKSAPKMVSMPASPDKQPSMSSAHPSPSASRKNLFKKK